METVDKLFSMVTDDRDPLLLVLGSLAEFTSEPVSVLVVRQLNLHIKDSSWTT